MGIKTFRSIFNDFDQLCSEKPPHHMGIKTLVNSGFSESSFSEKPPHHMGIKTSSVRANAQRAISSEKPPHHMGIKTLTSSQSSGS